MLKFIFVVCSLILVHSITIEGHGRKHGKLYSIFIFIFFGIFFIEKLINKHFDFFSDPNVCCTVEASNSNETFAKMQELKQQCVTELFGRDNQKAKTSIRFFYKIV